MQEAWHISCAAEQKEGTVNPGESKHWRWEELTSGIRRSTILRGSQGSKTLVKDAFKKGFKGGQDDVS